MLKINKINCFITRITRSKNQGVTTNETRKPLTLIYIYIIITQLHVLHTYIMTRASLFFKSKGNVSFFLF